MNLELITLSEQKLDIEVYEVIMPTTEGVISVFPGHQDLVTVAVPGVVSIRREKTDADELMTDFAISGGIIEISQTKVRILVDQADQGEEIVEADARQALELAREMQANAKDKIEQEKAMQLIDRHAVRIKVADLQRRRRPRR